MGGWGVSLTYYLAAGEIRCLLVHHLQRSSGKERPEAQQRQQQENNSHFSGGVRAPGTARTTGDPRLDGPHQNKKINSLPKSTRLVMVISPRCFRWPCLVPGWATTVDSSVPRVFPSDWQFRDGRVPARYQLRWDARNSHVKQVPVRLLSRSTEFCSYAPSNKYGQQPSKTLVCVLEAIDVSVESIWM